MGYLISDKEFTVPFDNGPRRTFLPGVNPDVTPEMAEHWYVRAAGGRYVEKLEDAHKQTPSALDSVKRARAAWEQNQRTLIKLGITAERERRDLKKLEKEFGIDTKARDDEFEKTLELERKEYEELQASVEADAEVQRQADAETDLSTAETERKAAGSEEVANTQMDGPAKADAEKQAAKPPLPTDPASELNRNPAPGTQAKPEDAKKPSTEEQVQAAGSKESANTGTEKKPEPKEAEKAPVPTKK